MGARLKGTARNWVDPDDAPELTEEFFEKATPMIGDKVVSKDEFRKAAKATGKGWQTRVNEALRDWLKTHKPESI